MSLLPAPRSGPLMTGRTAEDGIVAAWDTKLHKHCRRAGGMLFFSFPASKKTWSLVCSLLFLEPSWTAQLELIKIEKVKAFRRMSALQLPVSWMRNQETHLNDFDVLISSFQFISYLWWHRVLGALPLWSWCVWKLHSRWFLAQLGRFMEIHHKAFCTGEISLNVRASIGKVQIACSWRFPKIFEDPKVLESFLRIRTLCTCQGLDLPEAFQGVRLLRFWNTWNVHAYRNNKSLGT